MSDLNQLFCLLHILFDRIMRAVKHNRGESGLNALIAALVGAVV